MREVRELIKDTGGERAREATFARMTRMSESGDSGIKCAKVKKVAILAIRMAILGRFWPDSSLIPP